MSQHHFNYKLLMQRAAQQAALRVFVDILSEVSRDGLPGDHHFFIVFDTRHPGVVMAEHLRARYPEEMTIVLQEWFEDLAVMSDRFSVTLSFGNQPEQLVVPFAALRGFVDPSVEFGLKFDEEGLVAAVEEGPWGQDQEPDPDPDPEPSGPDGSGEVVSLDRFRRS
ncbi:MAG: ClpXP protease specificity-enhancing factor SspB [Pseudomonadota bacterium]